VRTIKYIAIIALIIVLGLQCLPVLESYQFSFRHGIERREWLALHCHVREYSFFHQYASYFPEEDSPNAEFLATGHFTSNSNSPNVYTSISSGRPGDTIKILVHGDDNESNRHLMLYYVRVCFRVGGCRLFVISPHHEAGIDSFVYDISELHLPKSISETDDVDTIISICSDHFRGIKNEFVSVRPFFRWNGTAGIDIYGNIGAKP
jgi:hypothetical protein